MALQNIIQTAKRGFDKDLQVCDSQQTITGTDAELQVSSADAIINVGDGLFAAVLWMDISAIEVSGTDNEVYDIIVQGSLSATFADDVATLAVKKLGDKDAVGANVSLECCARRSDVESSDGNPDAFRHQRGRARFGQGSSFRSLPECLERREARASAVPRVGAN